MGECVESTHDALGGVEEGFKGGLGEEGPIEAGDAQSVLEIEAGGVAIEATQVEADGDSLGEGFEVGSLELLAQSGLSAKQQGEPSRAVPVEIGEQGQEGEDVRPQMVGLVEDEQDGEVSFLD